MHADELGRRLLVHRRAAGGAVRRVRRLSLEGLWRLRALLAARAAAAGFLDGERRGSEDIWQVE